MKTISTIASVGVTLTHRVNLETFERPELDALFFNIWLHQPESSLPERDFKKTAADLRDGEVKSHN